jgi:hypothetical protein
MKKLIILVGLIGAFNANADAIIRSSISAYLPTENYAMFELKATKFQKVILDCQGFNMGVYFYKKDKTQNQIHMDEPECVEFAQFLEDAMKKHQAVCFELDADQNFLDVTDKNSKDCK